MPVLSLLALCTPVLPCKGMVMLQPTANPLPAASCGAGGLPGSLPDSLLVSLPTRPRTASLAGRAGVSQAVNVPIDPTQLCRLLCHRPAN